MRLTERDRRLVSLIGEREALTRSQIGKAIGFGSISRTNAVLLRLARHEYLARRTQATLYGTKRAVYVLGANGLELLEGPRQRRLRYKDSSDLFLEHRLAVNDVWLAFKVSSRPTLDLTQWLSDVALSKLGLGLIPDAYLEYRMDGHSFAAFLEADLGSETIRRFDGKVRAYQQLAFGGGYARAFGRRYFRVLVVTDSDRRLANLRRCIEARTDKIFWLTTRAAIEQASVLAAIWSRPKVQGLQWLTS